MGYRTLRKSNYDRFKSLLLSTSEIEWFFLSGGYGIIHALEKAHKYQATFNKSIACQNDIPYTKELWGSDLTAICDSIFYKFDPEWIHVFGSQDYTCFIKATNFWKTRDNFKMFESTGFLGPNWISPILNDLIESKMSDNLSEFNNKYLKFIKQ